MNDVGQDLRVVGGIKLKKDPEYGFLRVDPTPTAEELGRFYKERYFAQLAKSGGAPDIRRLSKKDESADSERGWLAATMYADAIEALRRAPGKRVLDVGCGLGDLVAQLAEAGFSSEGLEPSDTAVATARERGLLIHHGTIEAMATSLGRAYDGICMIGVLECIPDPVAAVRDLRRMMNSGGVLFLRVGNQFNTLQLTASENLSLGKWWVTVPDHLNYFDLSTIRGLLERNGFEVFDAMSDFPMEMFLLMGDNYVGDSERGPECHERRIRFELALDPERRRLLYRGFAAQGIGRSVFVMARAA